MKTILALALAGTFLTAFSSARAAPASLFEGVWTSAGGACPLMREVGTRAIFMADEDFAIITLKQGLIGYEFFCDFDKVVLGKNGKTAVISATCESPGYSFEDVIYLDWFEGESEGNAAQFEFNSELITGQARPGDGDAESRFIFTRCNDLSEQMLFERSEP